MTEARGNRVSRRTRWSGVGSWLALWLGVLVLGAWIRWPEPWLLVGVPALALLGARGGGGRSYPLALASTVLLAATAGGFVAHLQLRSLHSDWESTWERREARAAAVLTRELDGLLEAGEEVAAELSRSPPPASDGVGVDRLRSLRARRGLAAVAVYTADGSLVAWDGDHRGPVPSRVRSGTTPYAYGERPLFSYLYVTERIPSTGGTSVAVGLLRASLPPGLQGGTPDFAGRIRGRTGETIRISRAGRASGTSVWDLRWDGETLFSVSVVEPRQSDERDDLLTRWSRIVLLLTAMAWLLLAAAGRGIGTRAAGSALTLLGLAALVPLGRVLGLAELASPTSFLLDLPSAATLPNTLAVAAAGAVVLGVGAGRWTGRGRSAAGLALLGVALPAAVALFRPAPSPEFLAGSERAFVLVQTALALALAIASGAGLTLAVEARRESFRPRLLAGGLVGCLLLSVGATIWVVRTGSLPVAAAALWVLPAAVVLRTPGPRRGWLRRVPLWVMAAVVGATCALPFTWQDRIASRMEVGESELGRLATPSDPYTEFLLQRFAARADSLEAAGVSPVELLYGAWIESRLAGEGVPAWLTLWSPGDLPLEDLRLGLPPPRPAAAAEFLDEARSEGASVVRRLDRGDARYVVAVPLPGGSVVTAVLPPRARSWGADPLGFLVDGRGAGEDPLTLVPLMPGDTARPPGMTRWVRTGEGWRGERTLELPGGRFHAHYAVPIPGPALLAARGTLLLLLDGVLAFGLFGGGVVLSAGRAFPLGRLTDLLGSFRGRLTAALFAFFLLSVALFAALAYRSLSGAAVRTSAALAERVADEASGWYLEVQGSMDLLARRVGADLLEYRDGRLVGGSVTGLVELGLYEGWLPYQVHRTLSGREAVMEWIPASVGSWPYVVAYRRLPDGDVLGAPVPLQAGAAALRRRELTDLLGFSVVLGGGLSLGLALLVGRALARPLQDLRRAAGRVGKGDLSMQFPARRTDEFGVVFRDFNRMVDRLREARRDLLRTSRRTRAIVEEAPTGVVALDARGRVTLVNPRAEELLEVDMQRDRPLPGGKRVAAELARWVEDFLDDGAGAAGTELQAGERRIRVQARRISGRERPGGVVLSLEDVTDELRTERILAWGEMAQQVAHEVKNPLTPIKLSVQHIRRAWQDQRPEFDQILERNVEAMLREIDRLDAIARSFSRFAAPRAAGAQPLERVEVPAIVTETLDLYATDDGPVRFEASVPPDLPPVLSRPDELKEVLVNLLENARSAIEGEGEVRVEADEVDDGVEIRVSDDGHGIPETVIPRIFEPHFSTRSAGTGLGLAIVRRLVDSWNGRVSVESSEEEGTTVRVLLPAWRPDGGSEPGGPGADLPTLGDR